MIRHIVMFRFLPEAEGRTARENALAAKEMLDALPGRIPSLISSETHMGIADGAKSNFHLVLISDFSDREGLAEYIVHPLHKAVGEFMKGVRESRTCVDYEY